MPVLVPAPALAPATEHDKLKSEQTGTLTKPVKRSRLTPKQLHWLKILCAAVAVGAAVGGGLAARGGSKSYGGAPPAEPVSAAAGALPVAGPAPTPVQPYGGFKLLFDTGHEQASQPSL